LRDPLFRIVIDTNTLLRGLATDSTASQRIWRAAERRAFVPLLSKPVIDEYRFTLLSTVITDRFPQITSKLVESAIQRLRFVGDYIRHTKAHFDYARDPRDAKFIELAIDLAATHLLTSDRDLLSLPQSQTDAGKRFRHRLPNIEVIDVGAFMKKYGRSAP
jgi:putative PIN family toxin of toxin-antitoxin system